MANNFNINIVALDKFSAVFKKLNNTASQSLRPLVVTQRQVAMLGRQMHLPQIAKGMTNVGNAAVAMSRGIGLSLGPLQGLLGLNAGANLGEMIGDIAIGLAKITTYSARQGFQMVKTAQAINVNEGELQRWGQAAKQVGLEAEVATGLLSALFDTVKNAKAGRDDQALAMFNRIGLGDLVSNVNNPNNPAYTASRLAAVIQAESDAGKRSVIAEWLKIPPESLWLLQKGPDEIKHLADEAERLGAIQGPKALQWAVEFTDALGHMHTTMDGVLNAWGAALVPGLTKGIERIDAMINEKGFFRALWGETMQGMRFANPGTAAGALVDAFTDPNRDAQVVSGRIGGALHSGPLRPADTAMKLIGGGTAGARAGLAFGTGVTAADQGVWEDQLAIIRSELAKPELRPGDHAAVQREIAALIAQGPTHQIYPGSDVRVQVDFKNAPPGTTATARSGSGGYSPVTVHYSMPTENSP